MQKLRQVLCINFFIALFVVACQQVTSDNGPQPTGEIVITQEIAPSPSPTTTPASTSIPLPTPTNSPAAISTNTPIPPPTPTAIPADEPTLTATSTLVPPPTKASPPSAVDLPTLNESLAMLDRVDRRAGPQESVIYSVVVEANVEWKDTGIGIEAGERVRIVYVSGKWRGAPGIDWSDGTYCGNPFPKGLLPTASGMALIAKVDSGNPMCVGRSLSFVSTHSGHLYFSYNDCPAGCFHDNEGSLTVQVEVTTQ
jgi:hypothetical protein